MGQNKSRLCRVKQAALQKQSTASLNELLHHENINVNDLISTDDGEKVTPLWFAAKYNDLPLARLLLATGAKVNLTSSNLAMTPLHMASYMLNEEMVSLLLSHGAKPNVLDKWNYSPLMYVAIQVDAQAVLALFAILIEAGSDVNFGAVLDKNGKIKNAVSTDLPKLNNEYDEMSYVTYVKEPLGAISGTALHLATQNPHLPNQCLELLLEAGADTNIRNLYGQVPVVGAILDTYYDYHSNVRAHTELLHDVGTDLEAIDVRGWASFHYAAQRGSIPCMELLLKKGSDCNTLSNEDQLSPIWLLLVYGWREATRYLLLNGCDMDQPITSTTILRINQNVEVCRHGDIYPIEYALCNKYFSLAKLMVRSGCKVTNSYYLGHRQDPKVIDFLEFFKIYNERLAAVRSLKELCKSVIRNAVKQGLVVKRFQLGLPTVLSDFVCNTEANADVYDRQLPLLH